MERFNTQHTLRTLDKYCELYHLPLTIINNEYCYADITDSRDKNFRFELPLLMNVKYSKIFR